MKLLARRRSKSFYVRIFAPTFIVLALVVLLLELVVYWGLNREFSAAMKETQTNTILQVQHSAEALLRQAEKAVMTLALRDELIRFASDGFPLADYDSFLFSTGLLSLGLLGTESEYVHSVSLYNTAAGRVLTPGGIESIENSPNQALLRRIGRAFPQRAWVIHPIGADGSEAVITYVASVPLSQTGPSFLVLNLSGSFFDRSFFSLAERSETALLVQDNNGNALVSANAGGVGLQPEVLDAAVAKEQSGFALLQGESVFFTRSRSSYSEWTYVTVTPAENIRWYAGGALRFVVFALIGFLLFALFLSLGLAQLIYRPLKRLRESVLSNVPADEEQSTAGTELEAIERRFYQLRNTNREYEARFEEDRILLREKHLWDLVHGRMQEDVNYNELLESAFDPLSERINIVCIEYDESIAKRSDLAMYIYREVQDWTYSHSGEESTILFTLSDRSRIVLALSTQSQEQARGLAKRVASFVNGEFGLTFFVACGLPVGHLEEVFVSFGSADRLLQRKRFFVDSVIFPDDADSGLDAKHEQIAWIEKKVNDFRLNLERNHWSRLEHLVDEFVLEGAAKGVNAQYRESKILQLANIVLNYAILHVDEKQWLTTNGDPWVAIRSLRSASELRQWFHTWLQSIREAIDGRTDTRRHSYVEAAVNHCRVTFREHQTLEEVASAVGISAGYLSTIFKKELGVSFFDFMLELRLDEAKRILTETNDTLELVAKKSGFANKRTLLRCFKKAYGETPGAYRSRTVTSGPLNR